MEKRLYNDLKVFLSTTFKLGFYKHVLNIGLFLMISTILLTHYFSYILLFIVIIISLLNFKGISLWYTVQKKWISNELLEAKCVLRTIDYYSFPLMIFSIPSSYIQIKKTGDELEFFAEKFFSQDGFWFPKFDYEFRKNISYIGFLVNYMLYGTLDYTSDSLNKTFRKNKNRLMRAYRYNQFFSGIISFILTSSLLTYMIIDQSYLISFFSTPVYLLFIMIVINMMQYPLLFIYHLKRCKALYKNEQYSLLFLLIYPLFPIGYHYRIKRELFKHLEHKVD